MYWYITLPVILAVLIFGFIMILASIAGSGGNNSVSSDQQCPTTMENTITGSDGDWTQKGTRGYSIAKTTYLSARKHKFTPESSAGVVGSVIQEGGRYGNPDQAQGLYGSDDKTNGLSFGVDTARDSNGKELGGGIFQLTPYTKFAPLGSKKWQSIDAQISWVFDSKPAGRGGTKFFKDIPHIGKRNKVEDGAADWWQWEGGTDLESRVKNAVTAYKMFAGKVENDAGISDADATADAGSNAKESACSSSSEDMSDSNVDTNGWVYPIGSRGVKYGTTDSGFNTGDQSFSGHRDTAPHMHDGFDFGDAKYSGPIRAAHSGKVIASGTSPFPLGDDNSYIVIQGGGLYMIYQEFAQHGAGISVHKGQEVKAGDKIGNYVGSGRHMHFGLTTSMQVVQHGSYSHDNLKDPIEFLSKVKAQKP